MVDQEDDIDIDVQEDFEEGPAAAKPSLKEAWESNPIMKIAAVVLGGIIVIVAYTTFFGSSGDDAAKSVILATDMKSVKATPGSKEYDAEYSKAIEEQNQQRIDDAMRTGGSALPTSINSSGQATLSVPSITGEGAADPLMAWRRDAESRRVEMEVKAAEEDEAAAPEPEQVPLVAPVRPQQVVRANPEIGKGMEAQMRLIIGAQQPEIHKVTSVTEVKSDWVLAEEERKKIENALENPSNGGGVDGRGTDGGMNTAQAKAKVIVPGGSVVYAQLMNELNSDIPGPVLAHILSGPFRGGRALGSLEMNDEYLTLTFKTVVKDGVTYDVDGVALDQDTTLTGLQTDVDHHYFSRVILPAAAEFIKGYSAAVAETGTTSTVTSGGGAVQSDPEPSSKEELYSGLEEAGEKLSTILEEGAPKSITVHVAKGTTMGILFLESVTTKSAKN